MSRLALITFVTAAITGCSGKPAQPAAPAPAESEPAVANAAAACSLNSDCPAAESCVDAVCVLACREDRDCATGTTCGADEHGVATCLPAGVPKVHPSTPCMDEVACLLDANPPPCCAKYSTHVNGGTKRVPQKVSRESIKSAMAGIKDQVLECHGLHGGTGTVKAHFTIAPNGWVTTIDITQSPNAELGECIAAAVRTAHFGVSAKGHSVTYPWVFR